MSRDDTIYIPERSTAPDTPAENEWAFYFKSGGIYHIDDAGAETLLGSGGGSSTPNFGAQATKTISSGVVAVSSDRSIAIAAETGTSDDLVEITGLTIGDKVLLVADSGDTITVKHNSGSATIKILIQDDADFVLDEIHPLELVLLSTNVLAQVYDEASGGGGGGISQILQATYKPSSDYSTTSSSFVDVDATNLKKSITTTGGNIKAKFVFKANGTSGGGLNVYYRLILDDGSDNAGDNPIEIHANSIGFEATIEVTDIWTGYGADTYDIVLQYRAANGTAFVLSDIAVLMEVMEY